MKTMYFHRVIFVGLVGLTLLPSALTAHEAIKSRNTAQCKQQVEQWQDRPRSTIEAAYQMCRAIDQDRQRDRQSLALNRVSLALALIQKNEAIPDQLWKEIFADQFAIRQFPANAINKNYQTAFDSLSQKAIKQSALGAGNWRAGTALGAQCGVSHQELAQLQIKRAETLEQLLQSQTPSKSKSDEPLNPPPQEATQQLQQLRSKIQQQKEVLRTLSCLADEPVVASILDARIAQRVVETSVQSAAPIQGTLSSMGKIPSRPVGAGMTVLGDGRVLMMGAGLEVDSREQPTLQAAQLRAYLGDTRMALGTSPPLLWNPTQGAWQRLLNAPECSSGERSLHTMTEIAGGKLLVTGGICRDPTGSAALTPVKKLASVSVLNTSTHQWETGFPLHEPRIYHNALRLQDGTAILIGGLSVKESDTGTSMRALNSVELLNEKQSQTIAPLAQARAKPSSALAADGRLYVSGGFDDRGRALNSLEIFDPKSRTWLQAPAMREARFAHSSSMLADGRLVVAGGWGNENSPLTSVEIFDPQLGRWLAAPSLPLPVHGHSAQVLGGLGALDKKSLLMVAGGSWQEPGEALRAWAWVWDTKTDAWMVAASSPLSASNDFSGLVTVVPTGVNSALLFTPEKSYRWSSSASASASAMSGAPLWGQAVSASLLADGRSIWIGQELGAPETQPPTAHIFAPQTQAWEAAGQLNRSNWSQANSLLLPSKELMYLSAQTDALQCELWSPGSKQWSDCGIARTHYPNHQAPELGVLPDGRVFAIANQYESFVYDHQNRVWMPWHSRWHPEVIQYGIVVRSATALFELYDEERSQWFAHNAAGSRFWMHARPDDALRLLWDDSSKSWPYVLDSGQIMGRNAQLLPDGCALSSAPLGLFNPITGKAQAITGKTAAMLPNEGTLLVFKDGAFGIATPAVNQYHAEPGFYFGRANCEGLKVISPTRPMFTATLMDEHGSESESESKNDSADTQDPQAEKNQTASSRPPPDWRKTFARGEYSWLHSYWTLAGVVAVVALLLLIARRRPSNALGWKPSRSFRLFIYTLLALYALHVLTRRAGDSYGRLTTNCGTDIRACLDSQTGLLKRSSEGDSEIPCNFVGIWNYHKDSVQRRIEFSVDGRYRATSLPGQSDTKQVFTGYWAKQGDVFAWRHEQGSPEVEFNRLRYLDEGQFVLFERDGSVTAFELVELKLTGKCDPRLSSD